MTSERNDPPEEKKEKKQKRLIIILIILLLIALLFCGTFVGYIVYDKLGDNDEPGGSSGLHVEENVGEIQTPKPVTKKPNVVSPGWTDMTIPAGTVNLTNTPFHNPQENEGNYYLTFEVRLLDENGDVSEVLIKTGLIPPGKQVLSATMSRELDVGTYRAVLHVQPYHMEDKRPTNTMETGMTITVV